MLVQAIKYILKQFSRPHIFDMNILDLVSPHQVVAEIN